MKIEIILLPEDFRDLIESRNIIIESNEPSQTAIKHKEKKGKLVLVLKFNIKDREGGILPVTNALTRGKILVTRISLTDEQSKKNYEKFKENQNIKGTMKFNFDLITENAQYILNISNQVQTYVNRLETEQSKHEKSISKIESNYEIRLERSRMKYQKHLHMYNEQIQTLQAQKIAITQKSPEIAFEIIQDFIFKDILKEQGLTEQELNEQGFEFMGLLSDEEGELVEKPKKFDFMGTGDK